MFKENDAKYIKRLIGRNEVVLFLGSGFSRDAENKLKELNHTLEEKVIERTKELWDANIELSEVNQELTAMNQEMQAMNEELIN